MDLFCSLSELNWEGDYPDELESVIYVTLLR